MDYVSSSTMAAQTNYSAALVRRDLSLFHRKGQRGKGYPVGELCRIIERLLQVDQRQRVLLVGVGHLGSALARYRGFSEAGLDIVGFFDTDSKKIGKPIGNGVVQDFLHLEEANGRLKAKLGIIAVPADQAQRVADALVKAAIKCILNFAPILLQVQKGVEVRHVDVARELQILAHYLT